MGTDIPISPPTESARSRTRVAERAQRRSPPLTAGATGRVVDRRPELGAIDALVVNASLRQSLVTVRSLGRRGLRVAVAGADLKAPTFASRWCRVSCALPPEDATSYLSAVVNWLDRHGPRVLITAHDATIALVRANRVELDGRVRIALAKEPALAIAVNKERTLAVARRLGIRVPREVAVRDSSDAAAAVHDIGLPAAVKPSESWLWDGREGARVGCALVVTAEEARRAIDAIARFGQTALVQQFLPGRREAVSFLYADGEIRARFAQWALRTRPLVGGESIVRQSIAVPADIGRDAETLIGEIDLEGYSEVEFRRDAAGLPYLMEINPRLSASVEVAVRAGVDFPFLLYQWAIGAPLPKPTPYRAGGWVRHLGGDIEVMFAAFHERGRPGVPRPSRAVLAFGRSFLRPMAYDYFRWADPLPAVRATTDYTRTLLKRVGSRVRRMFA
jgi:predicted ATP-grasp superfamily ATP-dependent carboligase